MNLTQGLDSLLLLLQTVITLLSFLCCRRMSLLPRPIRGNQRQGLWWTILVILSLLTLNSLLKFIYAPLIAFDAKIESLFQFNLFTGILEVSRDYVPILFTGAIATLLFMESKWQKFFPLRQGLIGIFIQMLLMLLINRYITPRFSLPWEFAIGLYLIGFGGLICIGISVVKYYQYLRQQRTRIKKRFQEDETEF